MVQASFNKITLKLLVSCAAFSFASVFTDRWNSSKSLLGLHNDTITTTTKFLILGGTVGVCLTIFIQILMNLFSIFANSKPVKVLCLIFVVIGLLGLTVGVLIYGADEKYGCRTPAQCGYSYWFAVIGSVLISEACTTYIFTCACF
jgi:hypothetical protein